MVYQFQFVNIIASLAIYAVISAVIFFVLRATKKVKKYRFKIWGICSILLILAGAALQLGEGFYAKPVNVSQTFSELYSQQELKQDFKQVEECLLNENPLLFSNKKELELLFAEAYGKINSDMTQQEFYRLLSPLVAAVRCGHTNLSISQGMELAKKNASFFPLDVTLLGDRLYILQDDAENGITAGDEIIEINGKSSGEIVKTLLKNISHDGNNESKSRYIISRHFNSRFFDYIDSSESFDVKLNSGKKGIYQSKLLAAYSEEYNTTAWSLHMAEAKDGRYYDSKIYDDYAVLTIQVFFEEKDNKFAAFLNDFFAELAEKGIHKLVIDVRGNYGGGPEMARTLLSHLTEKELPYFDGELPSIYNLMGYQKPIQPAKSVYTGAVTVLTDGGCFSTTGHLLSLLKYHKMATLVGEESGGTFVCSDSSKDVVLKHTGIRLHYSTAVYRVAAEGLPKDEGVKPDIPVEYTLQDILLGQDPVMQAALTSMDV